MEMFGKKHGKNARRHQGEKGGAATIARREKAKRTQSPGLNTSGARNAQGELLERKREQRVADPRNSRIEQFSMEFYTGLSKNWGKVTESNPHHLLEEGAS